MSLEHSPGREDGNGDAPENGKARKPREPRNLENAISYSVGEFTEVSGLGRSFLYEAIRNGDLEVKKAGRRTIILRSEGERYLRELPSLGAAA